MGGSRGSQGQSNVEGFAPGGAAGEAQRGTSSGSQVKSQALVGLEYHVLQRALLVQVRSH